MTMIENLDHIIEEHRQIRANLMLVGESLSDREAMATLEQAKLDVLANFTEPLSAKIDNVQKRLAALYEGLAHHYEFEKVTLPPIVGEVLMEAFEIQHAGMLTEIESARSMLARASARGVKPDDKIIEESLMDALLERIRREKEDHMIKEEAVLELAKIALQQRQKQGVST